MSRPSSDYFLKAIKECRAKFNQASGLFSFLRKPRPAYDSQDTISPELKKHYPTLLNMGKVVWAVAVQANNKLFHRGDEDLPGVTVYSADAHYDANPQDLLCIAQACVRFRGMVPDDEEFQFLADRITNELDFTIRQNLPRSLTDGRKVFIAATLFHRSRLPDGVLRGGPIPVVIAPDLTQANMILPLPYWGKVLCRDWQSLGETLDSQPSTSSAIRVAIAVKKRLREERTAQWDTAAVPIRITDAMLELYQQSHQPGQSLFIGFVPEGDHEGEREAAFVSTYDPDTEMTFVSNGVPVVIRKSQLQDLRGTTIDYQRTLMGAGIAFLTQND